MTLQLEEEGARQGCAVRSSMKDANNKEKFAVSDKFKSYTASNRTSLDAVEVKYKGKNQ